MIFWDSSAIVPLVVDEAQSRKVLDLVRKEPVLVVWWNTRVECNSAISRREREGALSVSETRLARGLLKELGQSWTEIVPSERVREQAELLLLRHPLRGADALQLGAALTWASGRPEGRRLFTYDERLARAAYGEGFDVLQ